MCLKELLFKAVHYFGKRRFFKVGVGKLTFNLNCGHPKGDVIWHAKILNLLITLLPEEISRALQECLLKMGLICAALKEHLSKVFNDCEVFSIILCRFRDALRTVAS